MFFVFYAVDHQLSALNGASMAGAVESCLLQTVHSSHMCSKLDQEPCTPIGKHTKSIMKRYSFTLVSQRIPTVWICSGRQHVVECPPQHCDSSHRLPGKSSPKATFRGLCCCPSWLGRREGTCGWQAHWGRSREGVWLRGRGKRSLTGGEVPKKRRLPGGSWEQCNAELHKIFIFFTNAKLMS